MEWKNTNINSSLLHCGIYPTNNSITGGSWPYSHMSKYFINVETRHFSLKYGLECFNTSSNTNVHSVSVRYILEIFKWEIEFTRDPDNNISRQTSFLLRFMSLSVLIFYRRFKRTCTSHIAPYLVFEGLSLNRPFLIFFAILASSIWLEK